MDAKFRDDFDVKAITKSSSMVAGISTEDTLLAHNILQLKSVFKAAESGGQLGLDRDSFIAAMKDTLGCDMTLNEIDIMYTKIDIQSCGFLTWLQFLNHFTQECKEKNAALSDLSDKPFPKRAQEFKCTRRESIVSLKFMPDQRRNSNQKRGRYTTATTDGIVSFWDISIKPLFSYHIEIGKDRLNPAVVYDMVILDSLNMIAVSTSLQDIMILEIAGNIINKSYFIKGLENSALCMDFCQNSSDSAVLLWGDIAGNVFGIFFDTRQSALFGLAKVSQKEDYISILYPSLQKDEYIGAKLYSQYCLHDEWVNKVMFMKNHGMFLSCCQDENTSIYMGDFEEKRLCYYYKVRHGAMTFDYCPHLDTIAAGGMDYSIRAWNPYVRSDATIIFRGFHKPVAHIVINSPRGEIIGIDKGNGVRIYSLKEQALLQVLNSRQVTSSRLPVTAVYLNPYLQCLLMATSRLSVLQKPTDEDYDRDLLTHHQPVRFICYSEIYGEAITACEESTIKVWRVATGNRISSITNAHSRHSLGDMIPIEITAMSLDKSERKLITAAKDGSVKIWNYSNASALHTLYSPDPVSITGVVTVKDKIYVSGWNKQVGVFVEKGANNEYKAFKTIHSEEILSMAYVPPDKIVTASYDGLIVLWDIERCAVECKMHCLNETKQKRGSDGINRVLNASNNLKMSSKISSHGMKTRSFLPDIASSKSTMSQSEAQNKSQNNRVKKNKKQVLYTKELHGYSIEALLYLQQRPEDKNTANLIAAGADGWVRAWSLYKGKGFLLGEFSATQNSGENICSLATDLQNKYLFTGDSNGYLGIWDIRSFCITKDSIEKMKMKHYDYEEVSVYHFYYMKRPVLFPQSPPSQKPRMSLANTFMKEWEYCVMPPLLSLHRAHLKSINALVYVDKMQLIISGSTDRSARVWSLYGTYVGTFGNQTWESLENPEEHQETRNPKRPGDIKRVASAATLRVLRGNKKSKWHTAMKILKYVGFVTRGDYSMKKSESSDFTDNSTQILGKFYCSRVRHKRPPDLPKLIEYYNSVSVWHAVRYCELEPLAKHQTALYREISDEQRNRLDIEENPAIQSKTIKPSLTRMLQGYTAIKARARVNADKFRETCHLLRKDIERIDVDRRLPSDGNKSKHPVEPIVVS